MHLAFVDVYTCVYTHIRIHIHMYTHTCIQHTHSHEHTHMHSTHRPKHRTHNQTNTRFHPHTLRLHTFAKLCHYLHQHVICIHAHTHTHTYMHAYRVCGSYIHIYTYVHAYSVCDSLIHTYMHTGCATHSYIRTCIQDVRLIHTCIHAYSVCDSLIHTYMHTGCATHTHIRTCIQGVRLINTYVHAYRVCDSLIHTYMHTGCATHTYIRTCIQGVRLVLLQRHSLQRNVQRVLQRPSISAHTAHTHNTLHQQPQHTDIHRLSIIVLLCPKHQQNKLSRATYTHIRAPAVYRHVYPHWGPGNVHNRTVQRTRAEYPPGVPGPGIMDRHKLNRRINLRAGDCHAASTHSRGRSPHARGEPVYAQRRGLR